MIINGTYKYTSTKIVKRLSMPKSNNANTTHLLSALIEMMTLGILFISEILQKSNFGVQI